MEPPALRFVCELKVLLAAPMERGAAPGGRARIIPITGGTVTGDRISGRLLNLGADWQTLFDDGVAELDTRYAIETHDGALIDVRNFGYRHGPADVVAKLVAGEAVDPSLYYMRTWPRLHCGDPRYAWVNRTVFVGSGERLPDAVKIGFFEVL